ncbi:MAG: hypothetical protein SF182_27090 [Deltaproteobacteria bacterium]|nr:hypothetical protein [Deltaproteobacteria bacterium]
MSRFIVSVLFALALGGCGAAQKPLPTGLGCPDHGEPLRVVVTAPLSQRGNTLMVTCTIENRSGQPVSGVRYVSGYFDGHTEPTAQDVAHAEQQLAITLAPGETKAVVLVAGETVVVGGLTKCFGVRAVPVTIGDHQLTAAEAWDGTH